MPDATEVDFHDFSRKAAGYVEASFDDEDNYSRDSLAFLEHVYLPVLEEYLGIDEELRTSEGTPDDLEKWERRLEGFEGEFENMAGEEESDEAYRRLYSEINDRLEGEEFDRIVGEAQDMAFSAIVAQLTDTPLDMVYFPDTMEDDDIHASRELHQEPPKGEDVAYVNGDTGIGRKTYVVTGEYLDQEADASSIHAIFPIFTKKHGNDLKNPDAMENEVLITQILDTKKQDKESLPEPEEIDNTLKPWADAATDKEIYNSVAREEGEGKEEEEDGIFRRLLTA